MTQQRFPDQFVWGAATAAYQIEGSPLADGAGASIWHRFSHTPGHIADDENGDVACDHYRRWAGDVQMMKELGLQAYRFSISWSRILPEGRGTVNQKGIDFYRRLCDALAENGILPVATLYHWDLPAALDDLGGWCNRDIAAWFADYAEIMFRALDDRVGLWATLNEPWVVVDAGYVHGVLAPGHRNFFEAPLATHNLLRAHGAAVSAYRARGRNRIGIVLNLEPKYPASPCEEDRAASHRSDAYMNRQYLEPLFLGRYPDELRDIYGEAWPELRPQDMEEIGQPIDFLGVNYYKRGVMKDDPSTLLERASGVRQKQSIHTETGWEVHPEGLTDILLSVSKTYGRMPIYVTENGAAFYDPPVALAGKVDDPLRVDYLAKHIAAVRAAIDGGADVRGYFVWSLLDNFEWAAGYAKRFGIVHVDYATQTRTPKASAKFYGEVIRTHGECV